MIDTFWGTSGIILLAAFGILGVTAWLKKGDSVYKNEPEQKNPLEGRKVVFVEDDRDAKNADGAEGHLEAVGAAAYHPGLYERFVKRLLDMILSFFGLLILSPILLVIVIAIQVDDPGPQSIGIDNGVIEISLAYVLISSSFNFVLVKRACSMS